MLTESAAWAQTGPHAWKHTFGNQSYTCTQKLACLNATDAHILSNKLRLNYEQHMTCRLACTAVQQWLCKHLHSFRPPTKQLPLWIWCIDILKAEVTGIFSKSTSLEAISLKTSMQWLLNIITIRKDVVFHSNHFRYIWILFICLTNCNKCFIIIVYNWASLTRALTRLKLTSVHLNTWASWSKFILRMSWFQRQCIPLHILYIINIITVLTWWQH